MLELTGVVTVGDRVLCRDNIYGDSVRNGSTGVVERVRELGPLGFELVVRLDAGGRRWRGRALREQFGYPGKFPGSVPAGWHRWNYGYAMTVYSAQGNEWCDVVVFDDYHDRYGRRYPEFTNWSYTAITRARETVLIRGGGDR